MSHVKHILVAVDRLPENQDVLERAFEFAAAHQARVTVVRIVGDPVARDLEATERRRFEEQALTSARERIEAGIRALDSARANVDIRVEVGSPTSRIVEIANDLDVDLLVLRAHQRRSILDKLIGSAADRIIRATRSSVLIVKRPFRRACLNVLVAVDDSDHSALAAIQSAAMCPAAGVQFVHVTHVSEQFEQTMVRAGTSQANVAAFRRRLAELAESRMHGLAMQCAGRRPAPRTRVVEGEPARTIVRMTWNPRVDLVAVGPGEHGVVRRSLLGSVTQRLLREAACDVLISRPLENPAGPERTDGERGDAPVGGTGPRPRAPGSSEL